jgi:chromate transporter
MSEVEASSVVGEKPAHPGFRQAAAVWAMIGLLSFGGPAGQIALMHRELVEKRRWIAESRFLHALNFCMLLPGPEAQQLATYIGWLLHGVRGGLFAGLAFVVPGLTVIIALSIAYAIWHETGWLAAIFFGLKCAVLAIVVEALLRVARRSLRSRSLKGIALVAFIALFAFNLPFPLVILAAGLFGYVATRRSTVRPGTRGDAGPMPDAPSVIDEAFVLPHPTLRGGFRTLGIWGALWVAPFVLLVSMGSAAGVLPALWLFFSQMALVTFGGAYAVLAYVAQEAVQHFGWLRPGEMLDGLALAETTPGPLVLVLSFVGFLAAFREAGAFPPLLAGVLGATLTAWATFVPCFLWIFLGAPHIETLRRNAALAGALSAIGAAVSGVILNLAVWFALHVLFAEVGRLDWGPLSIPAPVFGSFSPLAAAISAAALLLLVRLRIPVVVVLAAAAAAGYLLFPLL